MCLPKEFWTPDKFGCKGGVELGFLSTTSDISVAVSYAQKGDNPTVWEMEVGQVRGEREMALNPLGTKE